MGRQPCCDKVGLKKGPWTADEDKKLMSFLLNNAHCCWRAVPKLAGLLRCGKSCRLRWINYLRPDLKRGVLSESEEQLIIDLHSRLGNRWSKIATHLPGRTDNEIKNYWNTHIKKKLRSMGIDPSTHRSIRPPESQPALPESRLPSSTASEAPQDVLLPEELETCEGSAVTYDTKNNNKPIKNTIRREFTVNGGKQECTVTTSNESEISCIFEDERSIDSIKKAELGSGCAVEEAMPFEQRSNISYFNDADPQTQDYQKLNEACRSSDFAGGPLACDHIFHPQGESEGSMLIMRGDDSLWEFADLDKLATGSKSLMQDIDQWATLDPPLPPPSTFNVQPVPSAEIASTGANSEPLQWADDGSIIHMLGEGSIPAASSHESNYGAQPGLPQVECISFPVWGMDIPDHYIINTSGLPLFN